jgi:hypothetical protein
MSTLIKFPGRLRPQSPPPRNELAALELELVRTRLAQIRSETRQANAFWFCYYLKKAMFWAVLLWLMTILIGAAHAQTRSFYDGQGQFAGSSVTRGNSSSFYGSNGSFTGSSVRNGNSRSFYDDQGRFVGSSINTGPRR